MSERLVYFTLFALTRSKLDRVSRVTRTDQDTFPSSGPSWGCTCRPRFSASPDTGQVPSQPLPPSCTEQLVVPLRTPYVHVSVAAPLSSLATISVTAGMRYTGHCTSSHHRVSVSHGFSLQSLTFSPTKLRCRQDMIIDSNRVQREMRDDSARHTFSRCPHCSTSQVLKRALCFFFSFSRQQHRTPTKHRLHVPFEWRVRVIFTGRWCAFTSSFNIDRLNSTLPSTTSFHTIPTAQAARNDSSRR